MEGGEGVEGGSVEGGEGVEEGECGRRESVEGGRVEGGGVYNAIVIDGQHVSYS